VITFPEREKYSVDDLRTMVSILRHKGGCPWDIEQTHESIRRNLIEEAYEAAEAIDEKDAAHLEEELGDVLTQVIFHSDIEADDGSFDLDGVADTAVRKLLYRHPHVFGNAVADTAEDVITKWDELKKSEKSQKTVTDTLLSVAKSLPALLRAEKVLKRAAKAEFSPQIPVTKQLLDETAAGELLLRNVALCIACGIDPEDALNKAADRYISEFAAAEAAQG